VAVQRVLGVDVAVSTPRLLSALVEEAVSVGDDAYTGAGSVITDDVPEGSLGMARSRQTNIDGFFDFYARDVLPKLKS